MIFTLYMLSLSIGIVGSALVNQLHDHGHDVRAFIRDADQADRFPDGVETAVGNLDDADSLTAAVRDVDGVFHMQSDGGTSRTENMITAMHEAGVKKMVLLSSIGARLEPKPLIGEGLAAREAVLNSSGLDVTYLRPNTLMSNALAWAYQIGKESRVTDPTGPGRMPCIDPDDIARVAALTLVTDGHTGHGYILNGPEALTSREQVEILADVLGREIDFEDVTPAEYTPIAVAHGMSQEEAEAVQDLNEMFRTGRAGVISDDVENLTGVAPHTFRVWCEAHADAFS